MRVLITGSTGFLGRQLAVNMACRHEVYALVRRRTANLPANVEQIEQDFCHPLMLDALPRRIDAVIHLAQSLRYREFPDGAADLLSVNVCATGALLDYAVASGARSFILASSGSVYPSTCDNLEERTSLAPEGYYAASKYAAELLAVPYRQTLSVCILRPFFLYGPGQQSDRMIPALRKRIHSNQAVTLDGNGDGMILSPTHVNDAARVFQAAAEGAWNGLARKEWRACMLTLHEGHSDDGFRDEEVHRGFQT